MGRKVAHKLHQRPLSVNDLNGHWQSIKNRLNIN
nr:MAG TPA: hypothetical protein [Caudoviricetes sp.]